MKIYLIRHGETAYNARRCYQGARDIPLSEKGIGDLVRADITPKVVYITSLIRTAQTAQVLFPDVPQIAVPDLREMDYGEFEGRSAKEMAGDPVFRTWVEGGCEGKVPGGERKKEFCQRVCAAFEPLVDQALEDGEELLVIVAHGGTQMALMERYALPHKDYFEWHGKNAGGYVLDAAHWREDRTLELVETVRYVKDEAK